MKVLNKKLPLWAIIVALVSVLTVGFAVAAIVYTVVLPGTVTIVEVAWTGEVGIYEDPNCTIPMTLIDLGEMKAGEVWNITFYVRNEGNATILGFKWSTDFPPDVGSLYVGSGDVKPLPYEADFPLEPNEIATMFIYVNTHYDAPLGTYDFNVTFDFIA